MVIYCNTKIGLTFSQHFFPFIFRLLHQFQQWCSPFTCFLINGFDLTAKEIGGEVRLDHDIEINNDVVTFVVVIANLLCPLAMIPNCGQIVHENAMNFVRTE